MSITIEHALEKMKQAECLPLLYHLSGFLEGRGVTAYIVGGWVRDVLTHRNTADIDIAVAADALEVARAVAVDQGGSYVPLDTGNKVGRVVLPDHRGELDFSTLRGSLEQDLSLRDFTIDAMAVDLSRLEADYPDLCLTDPCRGLADVESSTIRAVTDSVFSDDPARLLRAARLAAELGFTIENQTERLIQNHAPRLAGVAGERVREELLRILNLAGCGTFLTRLDELTLLTTIFPELEEAKGVLQPAEHHWDVFQHSLRTVSALDFLLGEGDWDYIGRDALAAVRFPEMPADYFEAEVGYGSSRKSLLRLAALLHDISKPARKTTETSGRIRFLGHAPDGAEVVTDRLEQLRFSAREIKLVEMLVRHHMRPTQMSNTGLPSNRAIYRFFRDTAGASLDILFLSLADHLAARGPGLDADTWREHARMVGYIITQRFEKEKIVIPPKLVSGYDIMGFLGGSGGPEVGEILEAIREAQASGEVENRDDALAFIERWLSAPGKQNTNSTSERLD